MVGKVPALYRQHGNGVFLNVFTTPLVRACFRVSSLGRREPLRVNSWSEPESPVVFLVTPLGWAAAHYEKLGQNEHRRDREHDQSFCRPE
jgi:hypothetical protein